MLKDNFITSVHNNNNGVYMDTANTQDVSGYSWL